MTELLKKDDVVISLDNVSVCYKKQSKLFSLKRDVSYVLNDITFDVCHGDSLGIIGGNGAGKSTLLKLLGGLIDPDKGDIRLFSNSVSLLSIQAGFVPYLSGRNNAILSGLLLGIPREKIESQLEAIKEFSGLEGHFEEMVSCYSAGMRSRLGFSASINIDPDVLLIDEILAVGDADFKKKSQRIIQEKIDSDKTVVLVSHNPELIRKCCNKAAWLEKGKLLEYGNVDEVVSSYENS